MLPFPSGCWSITCLVVFHRLYWGRMYLIVNGYAIIQTNHHTVQHQSILCPYTPSLPGIHGPTWYIEESLRQKPRRYPYDTLIDIECRLSTIMYLSIYSSTYHKIIMLTLVDAGSMYRGYLIFRQTALLTHSIVSMSKSSSYLRHQRLHRKMYKSSTIASPILLIASYPILAAILPMCEICTFTNREMLVWQR